MALVDIVARRSRPGSRFVKCEKRHRYVSSYGPLANSSDLAVAQAIAVAENEGWLIAAAGRNEPLACDQLPPANPASATLRR